MIHDVFYNILLNGLPIPDPHPSGQLPKSGPHLRRGGFLPAGLLLHVRPSPRSYQGAYKSRSLIIEVVIAVLAAAAVGVAVFFLALSVGIYL
jgi:hypothetical protein